MSRLKTDKPEKAVSRSIISLQLLHDALTDPRIREGVAELLVHSYASSMGHTEDKRQCFVCCRPWAPTIAPVAVVAAGTIGADEALVSLIYGQCFTGDWTQPLIEALERDLGFQVEQFVCEPPTEIEH
jgi:hypothetical protein